MLASEFRVESEGETIQEEISPERAASQLSLDTCDRGRIQNVLASTLREATTTGFSCYMLSSEKRGDAVLRIKPRLNALTLGVNFSEIPITGISAIIVESALAKKINRGAFLPTDLSLVDGAMGLEFHPSAGLPSILIIFDSPDQRRRCVALISLLRINPPRRRITEKSNRGDDLFHYSSPRTPSPQRSRERVPPTTTSSKNVTPGLSSPARTERPTRLESIARSGRPIRTNMARSPLRVDNTLERMPKSPAKPTNYFIDQHWRQYRSLSPNQRSTIRAGRRMQQDVQPVDPIGKSHSRLRTPPPLTNRLCEMCMTPPRQRYDTIEITSEDLRTVHSSRMAQTAARPLQTPPVGGQTDIARKLHSPSSSTQTTKVPDTIINRSTSSGRKIAREPKYAESMVRRFPSHEPPVELVQTKSPISQATIPIRFYSPMRTKQVRSPSITPPTRSIVPTSPPEEEPRSRTSGFLLGGDANACTRAINNDGKSGAPLQQASDIPPTGDKDIATVPTNDSLNQCLGKAIEPSTISPPQPVVELSPSSTPPAKTQKVESAATMSNNLGAQAKPRVMNPELTSFTELFNREFSETDPVEVLTTENTSTVIHARKLSRHPYETNRMQPRAPQSPPIEEEEAEVEREAIEPSNTDESFDISASMITPSYVKRKANRQLHKQTATPLEVITSSPLSATDESWRPVDALSPLDKLQLSRIGVPTPFTIAQMNQQASSIAAGATAFQKSSPAKHTTLEWR